MATIVVVEDQPDNLKLITALLTMAEVFVMGYHSAVSLTPERLRERS